jgi:archaellum component FlaG (FlaF/FlaG flagellin family)
MLRQRGPSGRCLTKRRRRLEQGIHWGPLEERVLLSMSDPGFESPYVGNGFWGAFQVQPTASAWVYTGGSGVSGNGSGFTAGNPDAPDGTQVAFLQDTGAFSQVFSQTAGTYTLSFKAAQRANYQLTSQTFQVLVDGGSVGTFNPSGTSYANYTTASFTLATGNHTVKFVGLNPHGGDNTAFVDSASLNVLSAPSGNDLGFEYPSVGYGSYGAYQYQPAGALWSFQGGAGLAGNGSGFTSGNPNAPDGTQVAFLQDIGSFSQSIYFAAGAYTIGFKAAQRGNAGISNQTIQVFVDGNSIGTINPVGTGYANYTTGSFSVAAGAHSVKFAGLVGVGDHTAFVDSVRFNAVTATGNDFGFETPSVGTGSYYAFQFRPPGSPWTFAGTAGLSGNGSGFTAGNPNAPDGTQVALLQSASQFSQSITLAAGGYSIGFKAAQRANYQASSQTIQVQVDGKIVATIKPTSTSYGDYTTSGFSVAAGAHLVTFVGLNPQGGDNTAFIDSVHFNPITPAQYNITSSVSGNKVSYSVFDVQRGITVSGYTITDGTFTALINASGVVCWSSVVYFGTNFDHNTIGYTTYDSIQGRFITSSTRVDGTLNQNINRDGVISWTSTAYSFSSFDHNTVDVVRYDINRGSWAVASYRVEGALLPQSTITAPNFIDVGGIVAWPSATYYFSTLDHNTVASATYDPVLGSWMLNSSRVAGTFQAMSVANGVVAWQSAAANFNFTVAYTTYDPSRTSWRTASTAVYNIKTLTNSGGIVGWTWVQNGQTYSARRTYDKPSGLWKAI